MLKHLYQIKTIALIVGVMIFSPLANANQCGAPAPLSADRQLHELDVPDLTKKEAKALNKFLSRFRKRRHGERLVEKCEGKKGVFLKENQTFSEGLNVDEGSSDSYRFRSKLKERKGSVVREPVFFLKVNDQLNYGEADSSSSYMPVKILAMSKNELRFLRFFRVNRRGAGSSIFEIYYAIVWQGKDVLFSTTTYINGIFFSEVKSKLR